MNKKEFEIFGHNGQSLGLLPFIAHPSNQNYLRLATDFVFSESKLNLVQFNAHPTEVIVDLSGFKGFAVFTLSDDYQWRCGYFPSSSKNGVLRIVPQSQKLLVIPLSLRIDIQAIRYMKLREVEEASRPDSGHVLTRLSSIEIKMLEQLKCEYLKQPLNELEELFRGHAKLGYARVRIQAIHQVALHQAFLERLNESPFFYEPLGEGASLISVDDLNWVLP